MYKYREAMESDFGSITKLVKSKEELFLFYPNGKYPFSESQLNDLSKTRKELTVAVNGNEIVGFANLYNYEPKKYVYIGNVIVKINHRGNGIGKEIISYMLNKASEKYNLPEVRISVFSDNTLALLLYSGFGFQPYEIEERKNTNGNRVALIHMKMQFKENEI